MTPDLGTFAPLLEAAFPQGDHDDADGVPDLRLRIADRSPAAVNPLVRFAATVLEIADSRLEASIIRELVTRPVVQQRFGFDLDTAAAITGIINDGHISWGLDADDRTRWGAGHRAERTWSRGLDRALAGVFYSDDPVRVIADNTVPLDGIEGQEAIPVGLLVAIIDRIVAIRELLSHPLPSSQWAKAIANSVRLLAKPAWDDEWQYGQLERLLDETFPATDPDPRLTLAEARQAVAGWSRDQAEPAALPHRRRHRLHPGADALGAVPGGVSARHGRRALPSLQPQRRGRSAGRRRAGGRLRPQLGGPSAAARCSDGGRRPSHRHLFGPGRAHQQRAATGSPDRGAAGHARRHGRWGCDVGDPHPASAAVVQRRQLHPGRPRVGGPVRL